MVRIGGGVDERLFRCSRISSGLQRIVSRGFACQLPQLFLESYLERRKVLSLEALLESRRREFLGPINRHHSKGVCEISDRVDVEIGVRDSESHGRVMFVQNDSLLLLCLQRFCNSMWLVCHCIG